MPDEENATGAPPPPADSNIPGDPSRLTPDDDVFQGQDDQGQDGWRRFGRPPLERTPNELVPKYGDYPEGEPTYVQSAVLLHNSESPLQKVRTGSLNAAVQGLLAYLTNNSASDDLPAIQSALRDHLKKINKFWGDYNAISADLTKSIGKVTDLSDSVDTTNVGPLLEEISKKARACLSGDITTPLSLEDLGDNYGHGFDAPIRGVALTHEQTWTRKGMALGNLLHSLALAPGEATRVAVQDWTHRTRGTGSESATQADSSAADQTQDRALSEIQSSVAHEAQHGSSRNEGTSTSAQAAFSVFGAMSGSVASNYTLATATTSSDGSKDVGAKENQNVHQAAQQHAQAARTRRATVVREINESDTTSATTRVVANYNRAHALTVQYFEVVEVYEVATTISSHQLCVFVPLRLIEADKLLEKHPMIVAAALEAMGRSGLADHLQDPIMEPAAEIVHEMTARLGEMKSQRDRISSEAETQKALLANQNHVNVQNILNIVNNEQEETITKARAEIVRLKPTEARKQINDLLTEFNEYFNQCVWSRVLTPRVVHSLLKGRTFEGRLLNDIVDPTPLVISGNLVGFPLLLDKFPEEPESDPKAVRQAPVVTISNKDNDPEPVDVAVPTGGVFAEAVLGQAVSAERIDLTRFWDWKDSPLPLMPTQVKAVGLEHTPSGIDVTTRSPDDTSAPIQQWSNLPDPAGLAALLSVLKDGSTFRDMSNREGSNAGFQYSLEAARKAAASAQKAQTENMKTAAAMVEKVGTALVTEGGSTLLGGLSNDSGGRPKPNTSQGNETTPDQKVGTKKAPAATK